MKKNKIEALLEMESNQLEKLHELVKDAIEEEKLISSKLLDFEDKHPGLTSRIADTIAGFGGSWKFIASFSVGMLIWIVVNNYMVQPFDPFPYILLNLILSTIAALQAPVIMMSQNRKEEKDRQRAINDYLVNLKAEIEIRNLHGKLDLLIKEQMGTLFEIQKSQVELMEEIKVGLQKQ